MKKFILYGLLCSTLLSGSAKSQVIDLLEDDSLENTKQSEQNTAADDETDLLFTDDEDSQETENKSSGSFFSFITKPLSLMFSADDEVSTASGKKETFLEKSIRQANEGNLEDQMNLGYMYLYGANGVEQDFNKSMQYYTMAAAQNDPIALTNLGSLYFNGIGTSPNYAKALDLFAKAADLGNDNAAANLAFILLAGGAKDPARNKKAIKLFEQAGNAGNNIAKFMLGYAYYKGFAVETDYEKAFKLIQAAAIPDSNFDEAQMTLAEMYLKGYGTVQNYTNALKLYRSAVGQGNIEAYMLLARLYATGKISAANIIMAHALYNIAAAQNTPGAAEKRDTLSKRMKLEELLQAQTEAQNFKPAPSELTTYVRQTYGKNIRNYIDINIPK